MPPRKHPPATAPKKTVTRDSKKPAPSKPARSLKSAAKPPQPPVAQPVPDAKQLKPDASQLKLDANWLKPDADQLKPEVQRLAPEVQQLAPEVQRLAPEIQQPAPEVQPLAPEVQRPEPEVQRLAPEVQRLAPEAKSPEPAAEPAAPRSSGGLSGRLIELFRLTDLERRVVEHLLVAESPIVVAELAYRLSLSLVELLPLLGYDSVLRARALVEVEDHAILGWPLPGDRVSVGRGLQLSGSESPTNKLDERTLFVGQAPGINYLMAPPPGTSWAQDLVADRPFVDLVREQLVAPHALLLWLGGLEADALLPLAAAVRTRLQRPVLCIEGAALSGFAPALLYAALRRLRRDADLHGAAVLVSDVKLLGGAWRALAYPRPFGQTAPLVLGSSDALTSLGRALESPRGEPPLVSTVASTRRAPVAVAATAATDLGESEDPIVLASREEARRSAARDAARAMGRPLPPELMTPVTPVAPKPAPAAAPPVAAAPPAAPAAPPAYRPPAPAAAESTEEPRTPKPANPRLAAALAKAGLPPPGSEDYQSGKFGGRPNPAPEAAPPRTAPVATPHEPAAVAPATPPPAAAAPPPSAATTPVESTTAPAAGTLEEDGPPLPIGEESPLDELIRVVRATPSNAQRATLLLRLSGARSPLVIQLFRQYVGHTHAGVRSAAESGMASLFGPHWNRARSIQAPTQPPRSDDGGRGPGGAF